MTGRQIHLRALEPDDLDYLFKWENDPANWPITNTFIPFSRDLLKSYVSAVKDIFSDKQFRFVIGENSTHRPIGFVDLFEFDPFHRRAGIGILIAEISDRNKGLASETIDLLKKYCSETLGIHLLYCNILEDNEASLRLFEKNGFVITGKKEQWFRKGKEWKAEYFLQCILDEE